MLTHLFAREASFRQTNLMISLINQQRIAVASLRLVKQNHGFCAVSMSPLSSSLSNIHITSDTLTAGAILDLQVLNCALFLAHFQSVVMPNPVLSLFNLCHASVRDGFGFTPFGHNTAQAARATQAYFTPTPCSGISHPPRGSISLTSYGHFFLARLSHSSEAG